MSNACEFVLDPKSKTEVTDGMFDILKAHFDSDIKKIEKYLPANLSRLITDTFAEVCGKGYTKRPSKKQIKKIKNGVVQKIRLRYGKFFDLNDFEYHNRKDSFRLITNLNYSYRHKKGLLYGHPPDTYLRPLFYTTHSLERFQERVDQKHYKPLAEAYKRVWGSDPTPASILDILVGSSLIWGHNRESQFLYPLFGSLLIDNYKGVLVCKTFLLKHMLSEDISWNKVDAIEIAGEEKIHLSKISDIFEHKSSSAEPSFFEDFKENEREDFIKTMAYIYEKRHKNYLKK